MNSYLEKIYLASPSFFQNCLVTGYGIAEYRRRYSGVHQKRLEDLKLSASKSAEDLAVYQVDLLKRQLCHAIKTVPYFRELSKSLSFDPDDINNIEDLKYLPILEKEIVRRNPEYFCDETMMRGRPLVFRTSGTTGKSLKVYCDKTSRQHHYAFWSRLRQWHGLRPLPRRATLFGRVLFDPDKKNTSSFWRYDAVGRNLLMSSYHLSDSNLSLYIKKLEGFQPEELIGYPSSICQLAREALKRSSHQVRPKVIFTTAESLLENQRNMIEKAFSCPVIDQYGCVEMVVFVAQCRYGRYHVHPEHGILEVLDASDNPVGPGNVGEAVCTGLVNKTMPLVRYRLGDMIQMEEGFCDCGFSSPLIKEIRGRADDVLKTPDGRSVGRLSPVWKTVDGIQQAQVVQNTLDSIEINIVIDEDKVSRESCQRMLQHELRKRVGKDLNLKFYFLNSIPKEKNGKFRHIISNID